ncbi:MAG: c-type cytochrome [Desulfatiglandaceae bacterium]
MKDLFQKLFPLLAVAVLLLFAGQVWKDYNRPYLKYQKEFKKLMVQESHKEGKPVDFRFGVRQRWIPALDRVDRCETCHLGVDDPRFKDAPQPYKTHPHADRHSFEKFGCTVCHSGQGMATPLQDAHGPVANWYQAITHEDFMQNSCSRCHGEFIQDSAPVFAKGRLTFEEDGCRGCHLVKGEKRIRVGRPLDDLAKRVKPDWLYRWIRDPKAFQPRTTMPNFRFSEQEAADVAVLLLQGPKAAKFEPQGDAGRGKTLFLEAHCASCHSIEGKGGDLAPELSRISSKLYPERLSQIIENPHKLWSRSQMPVFGFSNGDIQDIVTFLVGEYIDLGLDEKVAARETQLVGKADEVQGGKIIEKYGCTGCHTQIKGVTDRGEIGPELTSIGSIHIANLDFGDIKVPLQNRTVPNWLYNKMLNPRLYKSGLKMPDFTFKDTDAEAVTTYLLSLKAEEIPASYSLPLGDMPSTYAPQGPFGNILDKYRCLVCHAIDGKGGEMAPDLSQEGSRVQKAWLEHFMKSPETIRPVLPVRMPRFQILDSEDEDLYAYFSAALLDNRVEDLAAGVKKMPLNDPDLILLGRKVYYEKYACNACHQMDLKGGVVGPDLTKVGQRLRPEWLVYYLHDPKTFVKRSVEPVYKLTDKEIEALAAFLINPKEGS